MYKVTKKGGCPSAFKLKDKRVFLFEPDVAVELSDDDWKAILAEYSSFILPRIWSESNPSGCFVVEHVVPVQKKAESEKVEEVIAEEKPAKKKATRKK